MLKSWLHSFLYLFNIKKNILSRLFVALICVMFFSLLAIVFIWNNSIHTTIHSLSLSHVTDVVKNANKKIENDLHDLMLKVQISSQNYAIKEYFNNPDDIAAVTNLEKYLRSTCDNQRNQLTGIALITDNDIFSAGLTYFPPKFRETDWYRQIMESDGTPVIINRSSSLDENRINDYSIGILISHNGKPCGVLLFNISQQIIVQNYAMTNMNGVLSTVIIDENKEIVYSSNQNIKNEHVELLDTTAKEQKISNTFSSIEMFGETYLLTSKKFASSPKWTNITFFPRSALYKNYIDTINLTIWCMILVTLFAILIAYVISTKISKKFQSLSTYIDSIDFNNMTTHPRPTSKNADEIDNVSNKVMQMVDTISNQVSTISELEEKKYSYEMQILKAQINPHLIYNTLNAIQSLAEIQNCRNISTMTKSLSELLQYSIDSTDTLVPLADEIQYVRNYVCIMQHKFLNPINLAVNIEEDLYDCLMLKMTLQPIIENCIKHGLADKPDEYIMIKAYKNDTGISIKVVDNGAGIKPELLETLLNAPDENSKHIGLNNVNRRIKLSFGEDYGISIYSTPEIQTTVIIDIPYLPS